MRIKNGPTDLVFFLFTDHLGSTNVTSDPNGLMVSLSLYMPWGGSRGGAGTTLTDYGFNGQRSMEATIGLYYFNARWYDSSLGRWTQPDSIVQLASQGVQAWDRFGFVNNRPVNSTDPTGHKPCDGQYSGPDKCDQITPADDPVTIGPSDPPGTTTIGPPKPGTTTIGPPKPGTTTVVTQTYQQNDKCKPYLVFLCKLPSAIIYGFNFSGSAAGIYNNAGAEELIMFSDILDRAVFIYGGEGQNILLGGGSYSVYVGVVYNLQKPQDYNGNFASIGYTASAGHGSTGAFFSDASKSPEDTSATQGYYAGTAPGAQASIFTSVTNYNMIWWSKW